MTAPQSPDLSSLRIRDFSNSADLDGFSCGEREVDSHIPQCCMQHAEHIAKTYCAFLGESPKAIGFYTLSLLAQDGRFLDSDITRGANGHIVFIYLRYIGVASELQCHGIGSIMLGHALRRCAQIAKLAGSYGVSLNALTKRAENLYYRYGFRAVDAKRFPFMILPISTLLKDLAEVEIEMRVS
jgi:GNAT superfamily N-acetyltransferase